MTYRIGVTIEAESAATADQAQRDIGGLVCLLQKVQRGGTTITHAWIEPRPRHVVAWCEQSGVPVDQCVGCQEQRRHSTEEVAA